MATARGNKARLVLREQADFSTAEATGQNGNFRLVPFYDFTPDPTYELVTDPILDSTKGALPREAEEGLASANFSATVPIGYESIGIWLRAMFGAPSTTGVGPYTHTFDAVADPTIPAFSIGTEYPDISVFKQLNGFVANSVSFSARKDAEKARMTISGVARQELKVAAAHDSNPTDLTVETRPQNWEGVVLRNGAQIAGRVTAFEVTITNGITLDQEILNEQPYAADVLDPQWAVSGSITMRFNDDTYIDLAEAGTLSDLALTYGDYQASAESLQIKLNTCRFQRTAVPVNNGGRISETFQFLASEPTSPTTYTAEMILINATANYDR